MQRPKIQHIFSECYQVSVSQTVNIHNMPHQTLVLPVDYRAFGRASALCHRTKMKTWPRLAEPQKTAAAPNQTIFHRMSKLLDGASVHLGRHGYGYQLLQCCAAQGDRVYLSLGERVGPDAAPSGWRAAALIDLSKNRHTGESWKTRCIITLNSR